MHYYNHHIGDYKSDTSHLSLLEHGIYRQLLDLYYLSEKPLTQKSIRLISAKTDEEIKATKEILAEFFVYQNGVYRHKRCDQEIDRLKLKSEKAKASVSKRWNKIKELSDTNVSGTYYGGNTTQYPIPNTQNKEKPTPQTPQRGGDVVSKSKKGEVYKPEDVDEQVWNDFLTHRNKNKSPLTSTALAGIVREAGKADISLNEALKMCCERGWKGFKADWVAKDEKKPLSAMHNGFKQKFSWEDQ